MADSTFNTDAEVGGVQLAPQPTDTLNLPSHSFLHRVVSINSATPEGSIEFDKLGGVSFVAGASGGFSVRPSAATGNNDGGTIEFQSGTGSGSGNSGDLTLETGNGGDTGNSGLIWIGTGNGGSTSGDSGIIHIEAGGVSGIGTGANVEIFGSSNNGTGDAGIIDIAGNSATNGRGGPITLNGGQGSPGGYIEIIGGSSNNTFNGSYVHIRGGDCSANGNGGEINLTGADGGSTTGDGGYINIEAGSATTQGNGGGVFILGHEGKGTGDGGAMEFLAGRADGTGNGGSVYLSGGDTDTGIGGLFEQYAGYNYTLGKGGEMDIYGGASAVEGDGGNIKLESGYTHSKGKTGDIILTPSIVEVDGGGGDINLVGTAGKGVMGNVITADVIGGGTLYTVGDVLTLTGGGNDCTVKVTSAPGGVIAPTGIEIVSRGTGYTNYSLSALYNTTGGTGSGALIRVLTITHGSDINITAGDVPNTLNDFSYSLGYAGINYQAGDVLTVDFGDGNATITVDTVDGGDGHILTWHQTTAGSGYYFGIITTATAPLLGGSGSGAYLSIDSICRHGNITLNSGNSGYPLTFQGERGGLILLDSPISTSNSGAGGKVKFVTDTYFRCGLFGGGQDSNVYGLFIEIGSFHNVLKIGQASDTDGNEMNLDVTNLTSSRTIYFPDLDGTFVVSTPSADAPQSTSWAAGNATATGAGGGIDMGTGNGFGAGAGGNYNFYLGNAGNTGNGGNYLLTTGDGGTTSGDGGAISITSGNGTAVDNRAGHIDITAGESNGSTDAFTAQINMRGSLTHNAGGGNVFVRGGDSDYETGRAGFVNIYGGTPLGTDGIGGGVQLNGADGAGIGDGGFIEIVTGSGGSTGNGGGLNIASGSGGSTSGNGGEIDISGGNSTLGNGGLIAITGGESTNGDGGLISISGGQGTINGGNLELIPGIGTTTNGVIKIFNPAATFAAILNQDSLTADRIFTFPDTAGTFIVKTNTIALTNQGADISATTILSTAGLYRVHWYMLTKTTDVGASPLALDLTWTDNATARTLGTSSNPDSFETNLATSDFASGEQIVQLASGNLQYSATGGGTYGTATYDLFITVERLN